MDKDLKYLAKKSLATLFPFLVIGITWMVFCNVFCYNHFLKPGLISKSEYFRDQLIPTIITSVLIYFSFKFRFNGNK